MLIVILFLNHVVLLGIIGQIFNALCLSTSLNHRTSSANLGHIDSMSALSALFEMGMVSKDDFTTALRAAYQAAAAQ